MTDEILEKGNVLTREMNDLLKIFNYIDELRDTIGDDTIVLLNILKREDFRKTLEEFLLDTMSELIDSLNARTIKARQEFKEL